MHNVCVWTNKVYDAMEQGLLDPKQVAEMALQWLGENDVKEMCRANELADYLGDPERCDEEDDEDE